MLRLIVDFIEDAKEMGADELYTTFFPNTYINKQGTLVVWLVREEFINNPKCKYSLQKMFKNITKEDARDYACGLKISEQTLRRALDYLEGVVPAIVREKDENGAHIYYYDDTLSHLPEKRWDPGMIMVDIVDILRDYEGRFLGTSEIGHILAEKYGLEINRNKLARILNALCLNDTDLNRITIGRENYYGAGGIVPDGYISPMESDDAFDLIEEGKEDQLLHPDNSDFFGE